MLGDSSVQPGPDDVAAAATAATPVHEGGEVGVGVGPGSGEEDQSSSARIDEGGRTNYGANRWPRKETLALLKIRSDMDAVFRESSHKGPLWEEVSRKLVELGYNRSAKKCKEKFENVYKYHKRTKDGRTGKSEGKTYRFFDQLEAFDQKHPSHSTPPPMAPPPSVQAPQNAMTTAAAWPSWTNHPNISHVTVPSTTAIPMTIIPPNAAVTQTINPTIPTRVSTQPPADPPHNNLPSSFQSLSTHLFSSSTSSSTASDEELEGSRKRKRNWKDFFGRLTKEVIKMQEELQRKFLETVEKHERERMVREEAWRMQEMARINREHEILIQERSAAAAKDTAVIAFLQKISGQQSITLAQAQAQDKPPKPTTQLPLRPPPPPPVPPSLPPPPPAALASITNSTAPKRDTNGENNVSLSSSSRWPKAEVHALIRLRTSLDTKYQENVPKGLLWEEISAGMQRLGYNRSAKRCKEKWENINKYFKQVKESNRKRPEDSKTCPYFHQLDALYREKNKIEGPANSGHHSVKPMSATAIEPLMVTPEQQWPPPVQKNNSQTQTREGQDAEREKMDHQPTEEEMEEEEEEEEEDGDVEEEGEGGGFEMVAKMPAASRMGNGE